MLYIVATPIGNLEDLSLRQAKTLTSVDYILAEDTRSTGLLILKIKDLFGLATKSSQRLISYYKEKEFEKLPEVLDLLKENKEVALISQSGLPLISDPGFLLVNHVIKEKIPFTVIPGPTASTTAVVLSGFNPGNMFFVGFIPKKNNEIIKLIRKMLEIKKIIPETIFTAYDSPHRVNKTLEILNEVNPTADVAVAREITKKFEEVVRGKPSELINKSFRGEITLVIK
ncbi:MAG: 16S rRNA (cytidine(1402)-2'-O)-methyltransferase [Candidatus Roizmanbacteria bacterium]|nr:MAG: 16S rRNA (cytidine(1402)-2'-O)-methyltransferase [Candidatus Roizmanbacteria bacterium]